MFFSCVCCASGGLCDEMITHSEEFDCVRVCVGLILCYLSGVLISPLPDLLPDVFCLIVRIFRLMLVLLYISSTNIPPIMIINRIHETQNLLSL